MSLYLGIDFVAFRWWFGIPYTPGTVDWNLLFVGLALCIGLALLASVAAVRPRAGAPSENGAKTLVEGDATAEDATRVSVAHPPAHAVSSTWVGWTVVVAGVGGFALALVSWAIALFAPQYTSEICITGHQPWCQPAGSGNMVMADGGLGPFIRAHAAAAVYVPAFILLMGVVALGTYLHVRGHRAFGRSLVWVGRVLILFIVCVVAMLPVEPKRYAAVWPGLKIVKTSPWVPAVARWLDNPNYYIPDFSVPELLARLLAPSLCVALAVLAAIRASVSD
jgi:hypothetical protein